MIIFSKDGKLLMTKRQSGRFFPDAWVMPGGHFDIGETMEECVLREVEEETGIHVKSNSKESLYPFIIFESCFPGKRFLEARLIENQHLIIFFKVQL